MHFADVPVDNWRMFTFQEPVLGTAYGVRPDMVFPDWLCLPDFVYNKNESREISFILPLIVVSAS